MNDDNSNGGFISNTIAWFAHPFNTQGSALNWWFFVGLVIISVWLWGRILARITN